MYPGPIDILCLPAEENNFSVCRVLGHFRDKETNSQIHQTEQWLDSKM